MKSVQRGSVVAKVESAEGVSGILCRSFDGTYFFRTKKGRRWHDYDLLHSDLEVTIAPGQDAAFYYMGKDMLLDHSPGTMGYKDVKTQKRKKARNASGRRERK